MWFRLDSVNEVGELDRLLDEELETDLVSGVLRASDCPSTYYRVIVSDNVPISLLCIKPRRKSSNVPDGICAASRTTYGGETDKCWCCERGVV